MRICNGILLTSFAIALLFQYSTRAKGCFADAEANSVRKKTSIKKHWPLSRDDALQLQKSEAERLKVPVRSSLKIGDAASINFIFVPSGIFLMGDPKGEYSPHRVVKISKGFLISQYEITWRQFLQLLDPADTYLMYENTKKNVAANNEWELPALVDCILAEKFCKKLAETNKIKVRLPSEAEWEYACRAGTMAPFGEWDLIDSKKAHVGEWFDENGKEVFSKEKKLRWYSPVGQYPPNQWGIHDMMGNADEWCLDTYTDPIDTRKLSPIDPVVKKRWSVFRVVRGGSINIAEPVFFRQGDAESASSRGFRLVVKIDDRVRSLVLEKN